MDKVSKRYSSPILPDNAEQCLKCSQCGRMFTLDETSGLQASMSVAAAGTEQMVTCPSCGAKNPVSGKMSCSNEDY